MNLNCSKCKALWGPSLWLTNKLQRPCKNNFKVYKASISLTKKVEEYLVHQPQTEWNNSGCLHRGDIAFPHQQFKILFGVGLYLTCLMSETAF